MGRWCGILLLKMKGCQQLTSSTNSFAKSYQVLVKGAQETAKANSALSAELYAPLESRIEWLAAVGIVTSKS